MKFNSIQNSFSSGELSRKLNGRTNIDEYFQGLATMNNFLPERVGGANFRPGTCFAPAEHVANLPGALIPFSPRDGENYVLIVQPGEELIFVGQTTTLTQPSYLWNTRPDFTNSSTEWSGNTTATRKKLDNLQYAQAGDVLVIVDGEGECAPIVVYRTSANNLAADSLIRPQNTNAATGLPWLYPPSEGVRVPYKDTNVNTNIRMKPSATTAAGTTINITCENASAVAVPYFTGDPVGMYIKITHGGTITGLARVASKTSTSVVTAVVIIAFNAITASSSFEVSAWNPTDGYPRSVAFYDQRLVFGGNKTLQDMIWLSMTGNIYFFMQKRFVQDASSDVTLFGYFGSTKTGDPFNFVPAAVGANAIQWLYPADSLLCGTTNNEFAISGGQDNLFSVSSIFIKTISSHGSAKIQPVKAGASILFVSADGKRVLEIPKRLSEYTSATDLMAQASGIIDNAIEATVTTPSGIVKSQNKITRLAWNEYDGVLWVACRNSSVGTSGYSSSALLSLTMDKTSKVLGWARHSLAGNPSVSSICVSPDSNNPGAARLYLFLLRDPSGTTISGLGYKSYTLEYMSYHNQYNAYYTGDPADATNSGRNAIYMDAASYGTSVIGSSGILAEVANGSITLSGAQQDAFNTGTEFGVIEINDDVGTYLGKFTPNGFGVLTVPTAVTTKKYIVGVVYEGEIKTLAIEAGAQFGVAQGSKRRSHDIVVGLDRAIDGVYKSSLAESTYSLLTSTDATPAALFTGEKQLSLNASPHDNQTVIKQTKPYPMSILWILHKGYTYDV
jgi:hypothetical protein